MKKLLVCILAVLYIGSSTGATVHMHYCMGKLVEMGLWHGKKAKACSKCTAKESNKCAAKENGKSCKKKCCKDVHKLVKLDKDHKTAESAIQLLALTAVATPVYFYELPQIQIASLTQQYPLTNAPPRSCKVQSYILHCTFRI
jgi:hypothetical protein